MGSSRKLVLGSLCLALACAAGPARAETDPAVAEALFAAGRKAFDEGRFSEACDKFAESQRLDPGAGTLINLAACREKTNELALAWEIWRQALTSLSPSDPRRPEVEKRLATIDSRVPRLEIRLSASAPPGTEVHRDGVQVGSAQLRTPLPVNPGKHSIEVTAPGREPKRYDVDLAESARTVLEVEPGSAVEAEAGPAAPAQPAVHAEPRPEPAPPSESGSSARTLGWVLGGVGLVGVAVGATTGILAFQKKEQMEKDCTPRGSELACNGDGLDAARAGNRYANVSTVSFVLGALSLGVGSYLLLSSSSTPTRTGARVGVVAHPRGGALSFGGSF